jgi:hypothetical protein
MARADRAMYARVIGNLQRLAGVLLIDCGTGLGQPGVQAAILASDQLVVVTDASVDTAVNASHAESFGNFWAHQGVTTAEYIVGGGGGVIRSGVGAAKLLEFKAGGETVSVLPTSVGGRIALNTYFAAPGAAVTAVSPKIDHAVFGPEPPPPTHPHG